MGVVKDDETVTHFEGLKVSEIDALVREGSLLPFLSQEGSTARQVNVEGHLSWLLLEVIPVEAMSSELEEVLLLAGAFNVADLNGQVDCVLLDLQGSEEGVDVLRVVRSKSTFWVLDLEDSEIVVIGAELL